jgi:hypothetical protein
VLVVNDAVIEGVFVFVGVSVAVTEAVPDCVTVFVLDGV